VHIDFRLIVESTAARAAPLVPQYEVVRPLLLLGADVFAAVFGAGPHSAAPLHLIPCFMQPVLKHCMLSTIKCARRARTDKAASLLKQCYGPAGAAELSRHLRLHTTTLKVYQKTCVAQLWHQQCSSMGP
jgi:hypothetical protein